MGRRSVLAHLEGTEHCGEDVQLHRLLPDALGLLDALCKVVQHLKPALHREDTCVKPSLSTLLIVHIVVNTLAFSLVQNQQATENDTPGIDFTIVENR